MLGMVAIVGIDAYILQTFFKTLFLVILFGIAHSIIFLPVALTVVMPYFDKIHQYCRSDARNSCSNSKHQLVAPADLGPIEKNGKSATH